MNFDLEQEHELLRDTYLLPEKLQQSLGVPVLAAFPDRRHRPVRTSHG